MKRWIIGLVFVVVVVAIYIAAGRSAQPVDVAAATRGPISAYAEEQAKTRLPKTHRITMPINGRILPIEFEEGDRVKAEQVIARLEPADLQTAVAQARARVGRLKASIIENNDTRLELSMLEGLELELESMARAVEAAEAKTESSKALEDYHIADLKRKGKAYNAQAATLREYEQAQLDDIESRVDHRMDVLILRAMEAIEKASQIWPRLVGEFVEKKQLKEAGLLHQLAEAEAVLEQAERNLARGTIDAPVDGVVLHRAVSNKRVLPAGQLLLEIGSLSELEIVVEVLSEDAVDIAVGDMVEIFGHAVGGEPVAGTVTRIEPRGFTKISSLGVEQQRVRVIVAFNEGVLPQLEAQGRQLGVDYRVRVRIHTDRQADAIVIPRSALFRSAADTWQAFVLRDSRARLVDLTVGLTNDAAVEVVDGLREGDEVILAPETSLADGVRVRGRS